MEICIVVFSHTCRDLMVFADLGALPVLLLAEENLLVSVLQKFRFTLYTS